MNEFVMPGLLFIINLIFGLVLFSLRSTIKQLQLEVKVALLELQHSLGKELVSREEHDKELTGIRERVDLAEQMRKGFDRIDRSIKAVN